MINKELPETYKDLISTQAYAYMLECVLETLKEKGEIIAIQEGIIHCHIQGQVYDYELFLDNLIRKCCDLPPSMIQQIVKDHFSHFPSNEAALKYIFKDFDFAQNLLRVQIKPSDMILSPHISNFIYREDLPETCTFLVLDFENKFHYIHKDEIEEWEQSEEKLFEIALQNITQEDISIQPAVWREHYPIFLIQEHNFAAASLINLMLERREFSGKYGALVAMPMRSQAFVYPIQGAGLRNFVSSFDSVILDAFLEGEYPISDKLYWYYQGVFQIFQYQILQSRNVKIRMPQGLSQLIKTANS